MAETPQMASDMDAAPFSRESFLGENPASSFSPPRAYAGSSRTRSLFAKRLFGRSLFSEILLAGHLLVRHLLARLPLARFLLAIALLTSSLFASSLFAPALLAPAPLWAQAGSLEPYPQAGSLEPDPTEAADPAADFQNFVPPELTSLAALQIVNTVPKSPCPDEAMEISIGYLTGTGNAALDALLREDALSRAAAAEAAASWFYEGRPSDQACLASLENLESSEAPESQGNPERLDEEANIKPESFEDEVFTPGPPGDVALSYHKRVLTASSPSPEVISILYTIVRDYFMVNNPSFDYWSAAYHVEDGRLVSLGDVFPDREASLPLFWNLAARRFCETAGSAYGSPPVFYGYRGICPGPDSEEDLPLPEALISPDLTLPDLGFPLLTPEGLTLNLNPYQSWGVAMGPASIAITIAELEAMGANMSIWGR